MIRSELKLIVSVYKQATLFLYSKIKKHFAYKHSYLWVKHFSHAITVHRHQPFNIPHNEKKKIQLFFVIRDRNMYMCVYEGIKKNIIKK